MIRPLVSALTRFSENDGWAMASHVAMSLMLALFPFILFTVSLAGALASSVEADALIEMLFGVWPDTIAAPLETEIRRVVEGGDGRLVTLGGLLAIWFSSNGADAIRTALSRAYRDADPRPFWLTRAISLAFVIVGGAAVLAGALIGLALPAALTLIGEAIEVPERIRALADYSILAPWLTGFVLLGVVSACHIWMPGMRHGLAEIWPGVGLTLVLWVLAVFGFSLYVTSFADYSATYAGLAGVMAALIFLYLMAVILIFGAEFNAALIRQRKGAAI